MYATLDPCRSRGSASLRAGLLALLVLLLGTLVVMGDPRPAVADTPLIPVPRMPVGLPATPATIDVLPGIGGTITGVAATEGGATAAGAAAAAGGATIELGPIVAGIAMAGAVVWWHFHGNGGHHNQDQDPQYAPGGLEGWLNGNVVSINGCSVTYTVDQFLSQNNGVGNQALTFVVAGLFNGCGTVSGIPGVGFYDAGGNPEGSYQCPVMTGTAFTCSATRGTGQPINGSSAVTTLGLNIASMACSIGCAAFASVFNNTVKLWKSSGSSQEADKSTPDPSRQWQVQRCFGDGTCVTGPAVSVPDSAFGPDGNGGTDPAGGTTVQVPGAGTNTSGTTSIDVTVTCPTCTPYHPVGTWTPPTIPGEPGTSCGTGECVLQATRVTVGGQVENCLDEKVLPCQGWQEDTEATGRKVPMLIVSTGATVQTRRNAWPDGDEFVCKWGPYELPAAECKYLPTEPGPTDTPTTPTDGGKENCATGSASTGTIGCAPSTGTSSGSGCSLSWSFNPINWVYEPVKCAMQWAFEPSDATVEDAKSEVSDAWDSSGISKWTGAFTGAVTAIGGLSGGGCSGPTVSIPLPGMHPFVFHPVDACNEPLKTAAVVVKIALTIGMVLYGIRMCSKPILSSIGMGQSV